MKEDMATIKNMRYLEYQKAHDAKPKDVKEYRYKLFHYADKCCHKFNELDNVCQESLH